MLEAPKAKIRYCFQRETTLVPTLEGEVLPKARIAPKPKRLDRLAGSKIALIVISRS
jgi:hypothetical protein